MRSLLIATVMCAAALTFSGCSFTISGPCTSLSHQSRLQGCGCSGGDSCGTCNQMPECEGVNFGEGAPAGMANFGSKIKSMMPAPSLGSMVSTASATCGGNCGGSCDGGCGGGGNGMGLSIFETGSECVGQGGSCALGNFGLGGGGGLAGQGGGLLANGGRLAGQGGGLLANGVPVPGSRLHGAVAGRLHGGGSHGCGRFGCGRNGKLCLSCRARGLRGGAGVLGGLSGPFSGPRPYAGDIPHTAHPQGAGGPGAPQYVYPYYTTRGPRDFLQSNPPSIGY